MNAQTPATIFSNNWLKAKAISVVRQSIDELEGKMKQEFINDAIKFFSENQQWEIADEIYLASI